MKKPIEINYNTESANAVGSRINLLKWGVLFGFWTLFSILYANQIYFEMLHTPGSGQTGGEGLPGTVPRVFSGATLMTGTAKVVSANGVKLE